MGLTPGVCLGSAVGCGALGAATGGAISGEIVDIVGAGVTGACAGMMGSLLAIGIQQQASCTDEKCNIPSESNNGDPC